MKTFFVALAAAAMLGAGCATAPVVVTPNNLSEKENLIRVDAPAPGGVVTSPLVMTGDARGTWYFEASFPVELQDADGNVIAQSYAQAQGEWMTEDFVPFASTMTFTVPSGVTEGVVYLRKDNPSGLPEYDDAAYFPVSFE